MISFTEALEIVLNATPLLDTKRRNLVDTLGLVLADDVVAEENIPAYDNSSMDGYAVRSTDTSAATAASSVSLDIIGESSAGNVFNGNLGTGKAVRIMTGGLVPRGADAVIPLERVDSSGENSIRINAPVKVGEYIRRAGEDMKARERVITSGTRITPPHMGVLAALGMAKPKVFRQPKVNILATGDELVDISEKAGRGEIRNSSSYALAGYVQAAGGVPKILGIVPDKRKRLRKAIEEALACNLLLLTGGVSVGKYDYAAEALSEVGVEVLFHGVNIKPGKPLLFGRRKRTLVFGLPGNPVSTSITFLQFVLPALRKMSGANPHQGIHLKAITRQSFSKNDGKRHFLRGVYSEEEGRLTVKITGSQSSGVMSSMVKANCLIVVPENMQQVNAGDTVDIELIDGE